MMYWQNEPGAWLEVFELTVTEGGGNHVGKFGENQLVQMLKQHPDQPFMLEPWGLSRQITGLPPADGLRLESVVSWDATLARLA